MKNLIWIVVAAVIAVGGYMLYSGRSVQEIASDVTETAAEAGAAVTETVAETVDAASEAANEAAAESAAAEAAAAAATEAAAAQAAAAEAEASAAAAAQAAAEEEVTPPTAELLTVEGFDLEKVTAMVQVSDLDAVQKTVLEQGLKAAQDSPDMLKAALASVRQALGM
jgi:hypothetical protein